MIRETPTLVQLSQVISEVTAPAFMMGAVAGFASLITMRLHRILDRSHTLNEISDDDASRAHLKTDIPRLKRRAVLLSNAIILSTISAIVTSLIVIVALRQRVFECRARIRSRAAFCGRSRVLRSSARQSNAGDAPRAA
jgi:hypothetical protein